MAQNVAWNVTPSVGQKTAIHPPPAHSSDHFFMLGLAGIDLRLHAHFVPWHYLMHNHTVSVSLETAQLVAWSMLDGFSCAAQKNMVSQTKDIFGCVILTKHFCTKSAHADRSSKTNHWDAFLFLGMQDALQWQPWWRPCSVHTSSSTCNALCSTWRHHVTKLGTVSSEHCACTCSALAWCTCGCMH